MATIKDIALMTLFLALLGIVGDMDYEDEVGLHRVGVANEAP